MLGKAGLNVTTNGILLDSFLLDVSRALLRGIWCTLLFSSLMKLYLYPLSFFFLIFLFAFCIKIHNYSTSLQTDNKK